MTPEERAAKLLADVLGSFEQEDLDLAMAAIEEAVAAEREANMKAQCSACFDWQGWPNLEWLHHQYWHSDDAGERQLCGASAIRSAIRARAETP